jgi:type II secretory pathway pseudopilin PulG
MRVLRILFYAAVFLLVASVFLPSFNDGIGPARKAMAKNAVLQLVTAAKAYKEEYGKPPKGDSQSVLRILQNDNPRKIVFLEISPKELSKDGIYLDPWGTPYVFVSSSFSPWAYSFGKNKRDDGGNGDDAASWK